MIGSRVGVWPTARAWRLVALLLRALLAAVPGAARPSPSLVAAAGLGLRASSESPPALDLLCGYPYPAFTRFVVQDGGVDAAGHPVLLCSEYQRLGGEPALGLPISRPFRVGVELYQAFEYGVLRWRADSGDATLVDALDVLHDAGRDGSLQRVGIPPAQPPSLDWLSDDVLREAYGGGENPVYGLPTSAPADVGPYVAQRFQRGVMRRWIEAPPHDLAGSLSHASDGGPGIERLMAGDLLRASGLIPPAALVADPGADPDQYNGAGAPGAPVALWSPSGAVGGWDGLFHQVGAFDVGTAGSDEAAMQSELAAAATFGLGLAANGYVGRDSSVEKAAVDRNVLLIDTFPWGRIASACGSALPDRTCSLTADQLADIEQQVRHHLDVTREDDSVAAYWVLDDNPGDVRSAIELIHRLVQEDNLAARAPRPTICGFGGVLDSAGRPVADSRAAFDRALGNFTPAGCDAVALYPYAQTTSVDGDARVDWSMRTLLPYMRARLRERGWDPASQPLIGIPQTFRFGGDAGPTAADVAAQTGAYCAGGASGIVFYAWNDSYAGAKAELFDAADLRQGAAAGVGQCQALWGPRPSRGGPPAGQTPRAALLPAGLPRLSARVTPHWA